MPVTLAQSYQHAWASYQRDWAHIDSVLAHVIATHPRQNYDDIHTKVVFVDGVYRSQLYRTLGSGATEKVAAALLNNHVVVNGTVNPLIGHTALNPMVLSNVLAAHTAILQTLDSAVTGGTARSFASKYLHFHCDVVPIIDSLASEHIGRFLRSAGHPQSAQWSQVTVPNDADREYTYYLNRFVELYEHLSTLQLTVPLTVKGIDHMLWQG